MPWTNQNGGGGSGGGGGGPWKPGNPGPWGQGNGGGQTPPDLQELLRRGQEQLRRFAPGGGSFGGTGIAFLLLAGVLLWMLSGFYTVQTNEVGINMVFGKYAGKTAPGLNYNWPYPIGAVLKPKVADRNAIDIGSRFNEDRNRSLERSVDVPEESLMLTGDENIADVKFRVIWQIDPVKPEDFVFNIRRPEETIKAVGESAMREIVGRSQIQRILTSDRKIIEPATQELMQRVLNDYKAGVLVLQVQLLSVDPPAQVISAFRDVTAAQQDLQRLRNEAEAYANKVVPEARGASEKIKQDAEAFREQTVAEAKGQASRFSQVYTQYKLNPQVTRERIFLETMERVLSGADKIILDQNAGSGVVPYLPLGELTKKQGAAK